MPEPVHAAPLSNLAREHRLILRALDALDAYALRLESGEATDLQDLAVFARFFTEFADLLHHVKEEDLLLPALVRHGFAWDTGPVHHVRKDHQQERYLLNVLRQTAGQEGGFEREDTRHALASIRAFAEFERHHVKNEDTVLFPAVVERLSTEELAALERQFTEFDEVKFGRESHDALLRLAEELVERYGDV